MQRYIADAHSFMCDENRNVQFYETEKISFSLQKDYFCKQSIFVLSAARGSAVLADEATLLINERFLSAYGTNLTLGSGAVGYVFLQGSLHTVLPCIDALTLELQ